MSNNQDNIFDWLGISSYIENTYVLYYDIIDNYDVYIYDSLIYLDNYVSSFENDNS